VNFDDFWQLYPRKVSKRPAMKLWAKMSEVDQERALIALPNHLACWKANGTEKEYIPHPSTWLSQARWEDEIEIKPKRKTHGDRRSDFIRELTGNTDSRTIDGESKVMDNEAVYAVPGPLR
jgi:hypothetical protein